MSDLRLDPITGQWVAIAANRQHRPNEFKQILERQEDRTCPFCIGNEAETPEPFQVRYSGSQEGPSEENWIVRVVPNKYPSFPEDDLGASDMDRRDGSVGPYARQPAAGLQEVIIHSPRHVESLSELSEEELLIGFEVFRDRIRLANDNPAVQHAMLFKNCRAEAGASIQHIHSQLIGTPIIPDLLQLRWQRMRDHLDATGMTLLESIVEWELDQEVRVLEMTDRFAVLCPFASRFGFQVWVIPRQRQDAFWQLDQASLSELGLICQRYVGRLEHQLNNPAYNLLFHFAPREFAECEHWFVELFPRLTRPAGFEWGTGWWVNPFSPEIVAQLLREPTANSSIVDQAK